MKPHKWAKEIKVIPKPRSNGKVQYWKFVKEYLEKLNGKA